MRTPSHPGGTLRLPSRSQAPAPTVAAPETTAALPGSPARPDPAARKQAQLQFEREQQRASVIRRHQQTRDILAMLRARWPALFTTPVPLAVGVTRAIRAELGEGAVPVAGLSRALHYWTNAPGYLAAIAAGEARRNLDGTEAGVPDEAQRRFAGETMERHAARRATRPGSRLPRHPLPRAQAEAVPPEASDALEVEGKNPACHQPKQHVCQTAEWPADVFTRLLGTSGNAPAWQVIVVAFQKGSIGRSMPAAHSASELGSQHVRPVLGAKLPPSAQMPEPSALRPGVGIRAKSGSGHSAATYMG